jgi:hypothetical protein
MIKRGGVRFKKWRKRPACDGATPPHSELSRQMWRKYAPPQNGGHGAWAGLKGGASGPLVMVPLASFRIVPHKIVPSSPCPMSHASYMSHPTTNNWSAFPSPFLSMAYYKNALWDGAKDFFCCHIAHFRCHFSDGSDQVAWDGGIFGIQWHITFAAANYCSFADRLVKLL